MITTRELEPKELVKFMENEDIRLSGAALSIALAKYGFEGPYWFFRYSVKEKKIFYFFPLDFIHRLGPERPDFIRIVRKEWEDAGFEIFEQREMPPNEHFEIGIDTLLFCLKKKH